MHFKQVDDSCLEIIDHNGNRLATAYNLPSAMLFVKNWYAKQRRDVFADKADERARRGESIWRPE